MAVVAAIAGGLTAGSVGSSEAVGARCGGSPVATGLIMATPGLDESYPLRPAIALRRDALAAPDAPAGVVLGAVAIPAFAGAAARKRFLDRVTTLAGRDVVVFATEGRRDRHGRVTGQAVIRDETGRARWLQGELVAEGLVVVADDAGACAGALLRAEAAARDAGRGLFADGGGVLAADRPAAVDLPDFVVVEGTVETVGKSAGTTYLNFGPDRRTDTTVRLSSRVSAGMVSHMDPVRLAGVRIRVRGWAFERDGMEFSPFTTDAIEIVSDRRNDRRE
jgi:hypothetical protein